LYHNPHTPHTPHTPHEDCIFCKIIDRQIPARIIYEDSDFVAFHDIRPAMPIHFLIIPKLHIAMLSDLYIENMAEMLLPMLNITMTKAVELMGRMLMLAPQLAKQLGLHGFKLSIHNGKSAGQEVFHLHLHVMGDPENP
jgi:histidine triad (HIT) family protein